MDPLTLAGIGALVGLGKSEFIDRPNANTQRKLQAEIARYSPWTGMSPSAVTEADPLGTAMQGGLAGASFGQSLAASKMFGAKPTQGVSQGASGQAQGAQAASAEIPQSAGPLASQGAPQTFADALAMQQALQQRALNQGQFFSPYLYMGGGRR